MEHFMSLKFYRPINFCQILQLVYCFCCKNTKQTMEAYHSNPNWLVLTLQLDSKQATVPVLSQMLPQLCVQCKVVLL